MPNGDLAPSVAWFLEFQALEKPTLEMQSHRAGLWRELEPAHVDPMAIAMDGIYVAQDETNRAPVRPRGSAQRKCARATLRLLLNKTAARGPSGLWGGQGPPLWLRCLGHNCDGIEVDAPWPDHRAVDPVVPNATEGVL